MGWKGREGKGGKGRERGGEGGEGGGRERKEREGEGKEERMWTGPESGLPRGPHWLSAGLSKTKLLRLSLVTSLKFI